MTGQCPGCGVQRAVTSKRLIKAHSGPGGQLCPGTAHAPGRPKPALGPCPHPEKVRFATLEAAERRAMGKPAIAGLVLRAYECLPGCGWFHLTSLLQQRPEVRR